MPVADTYKARVAAGKCVECGRKDAADGYRLCDDCRAERRARVDFLIAARICVNCGSEAAADGLQTCEGCTSARRERVRIRNAKRRAGKLCTSCGRVEVRTKGFLQCAKCRSRQRDYKRESYHVRRLAKGESGA